MKHYNLQKVSSNPKFKTFEVKPKIGNRIIYFREFIMENKSYSILNTEFITSINVFNLLIKRDNLKYWAYLDDFLDEIK